MPLVSVMIPTYNRCRYLRYCLKSVADQTLDDYEVIVVDDGSTDGTDRLLSSFKRRWRSRLKYVRKDRNEGPAVARRTGLGIARGEYIAFLDSDDIWYPYKLECQIRSLKDGGVLSFGGIDIIDGQNRVLDVFGGGFYKEISLYKESIRGLLKVICTSTVVVRADAVKSAGMISDSSFKLACEDNIIWLQVIRKFGIRSVRFVPVSVAQYRMHASQLNVRSRLGTISTAEWRDLVKDRNFVEFTLDSICFKRKLGL